MGKPKSAWREKYTMQKYLTKAELKSFMPDSKFPREHPRNKYAPVRLYYQPTKKGKRLSKLAKKMGGWQWPLPRGAPAHVIDGLSQKDKASRKLFNLVWDTRAKYAPDASFNDNPLEWFPLAKRKKPPPPPVKYRQKSFFEQRNQQHFYNPYSTRKLNENFEHENPKGFANFQTAQERQKIRDARKPPKPIVDLELVRDAPYKKATTYMDTYQPKKNQQNKPQQPKEQQVRDSRMNIAPITEINKAFRLPSEKRLTRLIPLKSDDKIIVPPRTFNPWGNKYSRFYNLKK